MAESTGEEAPSSTRARRVQVLESALATFARRGYRRTSMDDVAEQARISRPGLYLYFPSKQALLVAAVGHALERDVSAAEAVLGGSASPLPDRLLEALDLWAGQYTGPLATDLEGLLDQDEPLLGELPRVYRARFRQALVAAVEAAGPIGAGRTGGPAVAAAHPGGVADVVLALAAGSKGQATSRADFRERVRFGLELLLP